MLISLESSLQHQQQLDNNFTNNTSAHWKVDFSKRENFTDAVTYQGAEWPLARSFEVYKVGSSQVGATVYNLNGLVVRLDNELVGDEGMKAEGISF